MRAALPRLVDHSLRVGVGFADDFLITLLRFSEFFPDFLGVELAFLNLSTAIFQDGEDRLVGELAQQNRNDRKTDHLREK